MKPQLSAPEVRDGRFGRGGQSHENTMAMRVIPSSELIINPDGSVFHLHLRPEQLADTVILVGDPGRVARVASRLEGIEAEVASREFRTVTGTFRGRRMSVVSTGIGTDNIDIVMNELDALANVDFATRTVRSDLRRLTILRLGTSGALQPDIRLGDMVLARTSVGFDGLADYYEGAAAVCNRDMEEAFVRHTSWNPRHARPYFVDADAGLCRLLGDCTTEGITISAPGFYAPQGRHVRLAPADRGLNGRIETFEYAGRRITNFEMESSAIAALAALMGHRAATVCTIIAQRAAGDADADYAPFVERMIDTALERLARA